MNLENYLEIHERIVIDVNIDGLPLFKSSREHFWPLLDRLVGTTHVLYNSYVVEWEITTNSYITYFVFAGRNLLLARKWIYVQWSKI